MTLSDAVSELGMQMEESQNERDKRVEELWKKLDPTGQGELDFKGLQKGLRRIDHREIPPEPPRVGDILLTHNPGRSSEECRSDAQDNHRHCRHKRRRQNPVRRWVQGPAETRDIEGEITATERGSV